MVDLLLRTYWCACWELSHLLWRRGHRRAAAWLFLRSGCFARAERNGWLP